MFVRHLTRWLRLPGVARSAEPVWVTPPGVRPDVPGVRRLDRQYGHFLVHGWAKRPEELESVEQMFVSVGGEIVRHPVTHGDRLDPVVRAFAEERLWLWEVPGPSVSEPAVFPVQPPRGPPGRRPPTRPAVTWIEISLEDETGQAVVDEAVRIVDATGENRERRTDEQGLVRIDPLAPGMCDVSFPRIDGREWARGGAPRSPGPSDASVRAVVRGEHASLAATRAGFRALETVWHHVANEDLRRHRNPNLLAPGDRIALPVRDDRVEECATAQRHRFMVRSSKLALRLRFQQPLGAPWARERRELRVGSRSEEIQLDSDGAVQLDVPMNVQQVEVRGIQDGRIALWAGDLTPKEADFGALQRLVCLGYLEAVIEDTDDPEVRSAVEEFQCDEGMRVTGVLDEVTRAKIKGVYGC